MKKLLNFIILFAALMFPLSEAFAYQVQADVKTKRIPMGTKLELETASDLNSLNLSEGDMFSTYLTRDVRTQTTMILPRGTIVRGNVKKVVDPKLPSKAGSLYLGFDHVVAPNGSQIPVFAGICSDFNMNVDGGIKGYGNFGTKVKDNWSKSGAIIKKSTQWGITSGEELFKGGKYLVTPFSAIGGTVVGGGYFIGTTVGAIFKKGNGVLIPKGTVFNILLLEPLDIPVSE